MLPTYPGRKKTSGVRIREINNVKMDDEPTVDQRKERNEKEKKKGKLSLERRKRKEIGLENEIKRN